jgi:hypothetical protein
MKEQLEDLFKTLDHQIDVCRSSIFTANDAKIMYNGLLPEILQIIEKNTIVQFPKINEQVLTDLQVLIRDNFEIELNNGRREFIDLDSAEFELDWDSKVNLTRIDLNEQEIAEALDEAMLDAFEKTFNIETNESE